jgi:O-antigen biosynthesis protein
MAEPGPLSSRSLPPSSLPRRLFNVATQVVRLSWPVRIVRSATNLARRDPLTAPAHWLLRPNGVAGKEVCLFVTYTSSGRIAAHALIHARAWAEQGFAVVMVVIMDDPAAFQTGQGLEFCSGVLLRQNSGYDFGAWASAIRMLPDLREAKVLVIANDSVYGPLAGFDEMVARLRASSTDVVGLTESFETVRHLQSYLVAFKPKALRSDAFWKFWDGVRLGGRQHVINSYELTLANRMTRGGLTTEALFPTNPKRYGNPTHQDWRWLLDNGFPYIKAQLIRDQLAGFDTDEWRRLVAERGLDPAMIEPNLADRKAGPAQRLRRTVLRWTVAQLGD